MTSWLAHPESWHVRLGRRELLLDPLLLGATTALIAIGYVMVVSATLHLSANQMALPIKQMIHIVIGFLAAFLVLYMPLKLWERSAFPLFLIGLALLIIVLIPGVGREVNGSTRWLNLFGFRVQVSELFKLASVIYLSDYINRYPDRVQAPLFQILFQRHPAESFRAAVINPIALLLFGCFLLYLEPDVGSAAIIAALAVGMFFLGGARISIFLTAGGALAAFAYWMLWVNDENGYRKRRIVAFLDPWADEVRHAEGWQMIQSMISFGQGEVMGVGLGAGVQKMTNMPEAHNDFIISVLAEELGLAGVTLVMLLFLVVIWRAFNIASLAEQAGNRFAAYVCYGIGLWFAVQVVVNLGVNMGVLPTKGLTLPLMSYGGASMGVMCVAVALLLRTFHELGLASSASGTNNKGRSWVNE